MQLTTDFTLLASGVPSVPAAALTPKDTSFLNIFNFFAISPGTPIHNKYITAIEGELLVAPPWERQGSQCSVGPPRTGQGESVASFLIQDSGLFLFGGEVDAHQQVAIDVQENSRFCSLVS